MITLVISTRNAHKLGEIRAMLPGEIKLYSLQDFLGAPEIPENAGTFAGNATQKAVGLAEWLAQTQTDKIDLTSGPCWVLADDSGLEVDALEGAPGVHSARFAALDPDAGNSPDAANNAKLLRLLETMPEARRAARFRCVLALTSVLPPEPQSQSPVCYAEPAELQTTLFEGACEGRIAFAPSGQGGFGYDPLFVPEGHSATFAELGEEVKNKISHRARALEKLRDFLERPD